ncbi:MAG: CHAT domain-containing protein, partial [Leptolyngbya sp.]|nr:CHAT domain-containing protein [Leptolyngbya sp.]
MIQEFHISITPVAGQDTYLLRTESVAAGVPLAETQVTWPVADWLAQADHILQDPLQQLLTGIGPDGPQDLGAEAAIRLGQDLYHHLFQGRMRDSWLAAQGVAQHLQQPLRLRLGFKDSRLQGVPWELLYGEDRPLATGMDITLCRYYQGPNTVDLATFPPLALASEPLQVLMVVSAPSDQHRLALTHEIKPLLADLRTPPQRLSGASHPSTRLRQPLEIQVTLLEQPGRADLVQALEQGNFQVLHYAGHSDASLDPSSGGGDLFLVNRHNGLTESLSGKELAGLLVNNGIWLAVFNSCRGAYTPNPDATADWRLQNLVQALVTRGVPGVIAMADRISDDVAITFTQLFYRNLRQGYPADVCLSRVRQGLMAAHGSRQPLWMLPILYLRPGFDGYLFTTPEAHLPPSLLFEPASLTDQARDAGLIPPDYSTDPDISSLAQEVFAGHSSPMIQPPRPDPYGWPREDSWIDDLASASPDTDPVADLVQQLTAPIVEAAPPLDSPPLPEPFALGTPPVADAPGPFPGTPAPSARRVLVGSFPASPASPQAQPTPAKKTASLRQALAAVPAAWRWGLGGSVAVAVAIAVGVALRAPSPMSPVASGGWTSSPSEGPLSSRGNGVVVLQAIQHLTTGRPAQARRSIEQLLDAQDLAAAQSVLAAAEADQLLTADLAFVRGRLLWQQAILGDQGATPYDARRAWSQAIEAREDFLEAWVALGFTHYVLADNDQAIAAWEMALQIDQAQLRDRSPDRPPQISNAFTTNALAGLAMAYHRQGEQALDEAERQAAFGQANRYLLMGMNLDPTLLDPRALGLRWIWT